MIIGVTREHEGSQQWTLPGGTREQGEPPSRTMQREVKEETGLEVTAWEGVYTGQCIGENWLCRCYLAKAWKGFPHSEEPHAIGIIHPMQLGGPFIQYYREMNAETGLLGYVGKRPWLSQ